ncbi:MAG: hypothetical protein J6Z22_03495 [Lachnospiraceae bacterium]|nr:hypothetical protein [Lachnospiraceae bacterium]
MKRRNRNGHTALGKAFLGVLVCLGMGFLLSGCSLSRNSVKLHSVDEMCDIVEARYRDAQFVSMTEDKKNHTRTFTFRDTKYGFTYQVTSHPNSVGMDGSTFYYDGAGIYYYYEEPFIAYFVEQEKENFAKHGIEIDEDLRFIEKLSYPTSKKFALKNKLLITSPEDYEEDSKFVMERIKAYKSVPETTENYELEVYSNKEIKYLGKLKGTEFTTAESERIEYFMYEARQLAGISDIKYLRTEKKKVSEVPGLSSQNLYEKKSKVTVYYFEYEGEEYFIVDLWVAQKQDNGGGIYQYYQNYKYYPVSE